MQVTQETIEVIRARHHAKKWSRALMEWMWKAKSALQQRFDAPSSHPHGDSPGDAGLCSIRGARDTLPNPPRDS